jgi:hypothetical protein
MLETDGALRTWEIAELPCSWGATAGSRSSAEACVSLASGNTVAAEQLADHRLAYLDYEGPVTGDRGKVTRLDCGEFVTLEESPDQWVLELAGHFIRGHVTLQHSGDLSGSWQLLFQDTTSL